MDSLRSLHFKIISNFILFFDSLPYIQKGKVKIFVKPKKMASLAPGPVAVRSREELMEQCSQELQGALDPLPRQFSSTPSSGWPKYFKEQCSQ